MSEYKSITKISIENFNKAYQDGKNIYPQSKDFTVVGEDGNEYKFKKKSLRYQLFNKSVKCVDCGIVGQYYSIELHENDTQNNRPHANLYAVNELGEKIMMTKDHILRKRHGGKDNIENLQTMCEICNCVIKN